MALAKLWNAVFGKRPAAEPAPVAKPIVGSGSGNPAPVMSSNERKHTNVAAVASANTPIAKVAVSLKATAAPKASVNQASTKTTELGGATTLKLSKSKAKAKSREAKAVLTEPLAVVAESASVIRMYRRKNNAWSKLLGSRTINVVLDLNVQDGSRAVELLEAIVDSNFPAPKYVAIGMFELAGEMLTVREFHQKVRSAGGLPVVIPMPLVDGLRRLSQTIGTADLILLDITEQQFADPVVSRLLQRVASKDTLLLRRDAKDRWHAITSQSRAA